MVETVSRGRVKSRGIEGCNIRVLNRKGMVATYYFSYENCIIKHKQMQKYYNNCFSQKECYPILLHMRLVKYMYIKIRDTAKTKQNIKFKST